MVPRPPNRIVHLELHTGDQAAACDFYARLCGWRAERLAARGGSYVALDMDGPLGGGVVECRTPRPLWLPYVEVPDLRAATDCAQELGALVLLEPREGPAGWRSVVAQGAGGEVALWQPKQPSNSEAY